MIYFQVTYLQLRSHRALYSFIHTEHLYSASSRELLRGATDSSTAKKTAMWEPETQTFTLWVLTNIRVGYMYCLIFKSLPVPYILSRDYADTCVNKRANQLECQSLDLWSSYILENVVSIVERQSLSSPVNESMIAFVCRPLFPRVDSWATLFSQYVQRVAQSCIGPNA